ncbi:MAG: OmpH family outer membrane protein [Fuerstiella sp.]|nr:OmpH family outer membrane protein [Fuerstiella sp.]
MKKMSCVATVLTASLLTVGCGTQHSGGVAVVDLDRVAKELGRDVTMVQQLQQQQTGLTQKLAAVKSSFEKQLTETFEELPETPDEEQTKQLLNMKRNANIRLATYRKQAGTALEQMKNSVITSFRSEAMPVARDVAKERGLSVVLTSNDSVVFTFDKTVDITDDVIARLETTTPMLSSAPQTPLKTAPTPATPKVTAAAPAETKSNDGD